MTERPTIEPFETRFDGRVRAYTDAATARPFDALAASRTAMASQSARGWVRGGPGAGPSGQRSVGVRWAVAGLAVVLVGVVGVGLLGRAWVSSSPSPAAPTGGPIPDVLRHSWQRPLPVAPGPDLLGSGSLILASGQLQSRRDPDAAASTSAVGATDIDTLAVTATGETVGCAVGDVGTYRWLVEGKGTVLTLTAIGTDACAVREDALAGPWVRADLPPPVDGAAPMSSGTYETSSFDPVGDPAAPIRLGYTVPKGWKVKEDRPDSFLLHLLRDAPQGQPATDSFLSLMAQPRMAADFTDGAACGPVEDAPGVGRGLDDLVAAIRARPGVVSTPPVALTIGGYEGQLLDLRIAPDWTGGCLAPEGLIVAIPILQGAEPGVFGVEPDHPIRLILLDLGDDRTLAIGISDIGPAQPSLFEAHMAEVMPVVESFEFRPPTP
jgi:hypothetical protein